MCKQDEVDLEQIDKMIDNLIEASPNYFDVIVGLSATLTAFVHSRVEDPPTLVIANRLYQYVRNTADDITSKLND